MRVQSFEVVGLFGNPTPISGTMNADLNLVTGRNGSGKTSVLKLIWFTISGNILLALKEVEFRRFTLETDVYKIVIHRLSRNTCKVEYVNGSENYVFEDEHDVDGEFIMNAEDPANERLRDIGSSVFFPTFRRIEGGFGLTESRQTPGWNLPILGSAPKNPVESGLQELSKTLSHKRHTFVTSISTVDVATILLQKFTELSDRYNKIQQDTSQSVINTIKLYESDEDDLLSVRETADEVIANIKQLIEGLDNQREDVMRPLEAVRELVQRLIGKVGIKFGTRLSFGDAANAINSELLSAGEKQMLSFICYNAFYSDSIILIDEPELSLHVDWQRQLFSILMEQQSTNQFIVSTHSPFIYNKYPDCEIVIDEDRGNQDQEIELA